MTVTVGAAGSSTHLRTCPLCEAMCGLEIDVTDGRVTRIRGDRYDVWSKGYLCPKGTALGQVHDDPDRLRTPMIRHGDEWREATWAEAFAEVERRLRPILDRHGSEAVAVYFGNPVAHNYSLSRYVAPFMAMAGNPQVYSAGTVDQWPKNLVCALLYGAMWTIPIPDLDRTDFLLVLGANPSASQGSLLAAADVPSRLKAISARGGRVVVVDPRRTRTADEADEWLPIRPGTDALLLAAMAQVLFAEGLVAVDALAGRVDGIDEVRDLVAGFTPEAVAATCGVPAEAIRSLARQLAAARAGSVYGRIGTCTQEFGTLASWLVEVVNVLTGNLDRVGGSMFAKPIAWSLLAVPDPAMPEGFAFGRWHSRVRGAPEVLGQFPVSCLAEEIAAPGDGQLKALITIAGNPAVSAPDADRLEAALPQLEAMISVDNWLNETTRHAHVILPGQSPLETAHYDEMIWSWAVRSAGKWSAPVFEPDPGRPAEWQIMLMLASIMMGQAAADTDVDGLDDLFFGGFVEMLTAMPGSAVYGHDPAAIVADTAGRGPDRMVDFAIRSGPFGDGYGTDPEGLTLDRLRAEEHGVDLGPMVPRLDEVLRTPSGRVDLAPPYITADLDRLRDRLDRPEPDLLLVSRRDLRSNNSWMHNAPVLMKGRARCTLLISPDDAAGRGLVHGSMARVTSEAGSLDVACEVSDEMMSGVVCLPHGWGHDRPGARLSVASQHAGVNSNRLNPGFLVDVPSGNQVVNGVPVEVEPA